MKMLLDSAKIDEIREALEIWDIDGVTTNPRHIQNAGRDFRSTIAEIAELVAGTDKAVSVEVNPHLVDWREMVAEGVGLSKLSPNFVIKVGVSQAGCRAIRELTGQGIRVNATLVFSAAQAWHAARSGASFISPFLGWKESHGDVAHTLVPDVARLLANFGYAAEIIVAAVRNSRQIAEAALAGAHCVTASAAVYRDSFNNPYTVMGEKIFQDAWDATPSS
jgi:transaldolase